MIRQVGVTLLLFLFFLLFFALFFPKERLCHALLNALSREHLQVCFSGDTPWQNGCPARNITLLYGGAPIARAASANFSIRKFEVHDIRLKGAVAQWWPYRINRIAFQPWRGGLWAVGGFGKLEGKVRYLKRKIMWILYPSEKVLHLHPVWLQWFRQRNGRYEYEMAF